MSNQEASMLAKAFLNIWVSGFGCPANLHSNKGNSFKSNLFKNMCKELRINRTSTTAYDPPRNAMIERTNFTIEESLAKYVGEHHNTWSNYLPLVIMAYRWSIHSVTKYSPFYLLFGQSCALPNDCMYQTIQSKIYSTLSDFVGCLKDELQTCHELQRESMAVEQESQKTYYDRSTFNPTMNTGQTKKFKSFYSGPQVIREIINNLNFVIEDVKTKKNNKKSPTIDSNVLTVEVIPLIEKEPKKGKIEPRIPRNDFREVNDFVEIEVVIPKLNDTERREVNLEVNISQVNPSSENHNDTVKDELFETPMGGSTSESINKNTNNKS